MGGESSFPLVSPGSCEILMRPCVPLWLCNEDTIPRSQPTACRRQAPQQRPLFLFLPRSLSLGRAQPSDEVGGRNINSNSCFLTPAVSLPEHTFFGESYSGKQKREGFFGGTGENWGAGVRDLTHSGPSSPSRAGRAPLARHTPPSAVHRARAK